MEGPRSFVRAQDAPVEQVEPGITRQVLGHDESLMLVRVTFKKGAIGYLHAHPHRQVSYVESGAFEVSLDGRTTVLGKGDCYFASPGVPHGALALEDGVLIDVFTPRREDFL
ncbi:MAG TPA: cupin domain-containing protein [Vicinamibacteria bacterium]|nr:cupin domain-containing protein [Vicinamibacteria bacterium]